MQRVELLGLICEALGRCGLLQGLLGQGGQLRGQGCDGLPIS